MSLAPSSVEELQEVVRSTARVLPRGGATKTALSSAEDDLTVVDMGAVRGIVEHQPSEFTVTARAGTTIEEVEAALESVGQFLPFDPLLRLAGATLGGTVASGLCGSGRLRYGGIRDFILGIQLVDGVGNTIRAGGRVVKNAAGFDLPKLMVGSLGALGVLTEITFKVFPKPPAELTLEVEFEDLSAALVAVRKLAQGPFELAALELESDGRLWLRLAGRSESIEKRGRRLASRLGGASVVEAAAARRYWRSLEELEWLLPQSTLVKVPVSPARIQALDSAVADLCSPRRYGAGGQQAWLTCASGEVLSQLDAVLTELGLRGLAVIGGGGRRLLGTPLDGHLLGRIRSALDPESKFRAL